LLSALVSSLTIFWFIKLFTRDYRFAAGAVWIILGFGTLLAGQGMLRHFLNLPYLIPEWVSKLVTSPSIYHLPFLRSYQPSVAFPLFFLLVGLVWLALVETDAVKSLAFSAAAGLTFAGLVFSYFFLWTMAAAWLSCVFLLWLLVLKNRRRALLVVGITTVFAVPALLVYFMMLSRRAATVDSVQALIRTHQPDVFRMPEIVALLVLALLVWGHSRKVFQIDEESLFVTSLALGIVVVFNQQIITGQSLQPAHYEWFIANYCVAAAVVLLVALWRRKSSLQLNGRGWALLALAALIWGGGEVWLASSLGLSHNRSIDEGRPIASRLNKLALNAGTSSETAGEDVAPVVLMSELSLADRFPTDAPQSLLWAPRMLVFPGVSESENRERFFQQLYYLGFDEKKFNQQLDRKDWNFYAGLFSYDRLSPAVSGSTRPISAEEVRAQLSAYLAYSQSFTRERAIAPTLSYLIVKANAEPDYANLDRWYERSGREESGGFVLYRLKLRD
jgi:hypothetical protein